EAHRPLIGHAIEKHGSQPFQMWKVADDENVIRVHLQKIRHLGGIVRRIQTAGVTGAGRGSHRRRKDMRGFLGPFLSAVLNERHSDAQTREKFCNRRYFGAPFIRQAAIGIFLSRFRLSVLNEVSTHHFLLRPVYRVGRISLARTSIALIIDSSVASSSTLVL